jgi:hypothetical protein
MCRLLRGTTAWLLVLSGFVASPSTIRAKSVVESDEQTLTATDGAALLAAVRKHTPTSGDYDKIRRLITQLGNDQFRTREKATDELFALGRISLPQLQQARKNADAEVARRARLLIERIESEPACHLPVAVVRLLAVRKPAGAVEALLNYLPHAEDESLSDAVRQSLIVLALRDGEPDPVLLRALTDAQAEIRAAAAEALIRGADGRGRSVAGKLLKDAAPVVRLRVALALAFVKEREGVPVLIDLLGVLPVDRVGEAEAALYQLAGDSAPNTPTGTEPAERKKYRDAWAAWWKVNAERVDLGRLKERPWHGFTLLCDTGKNRVCEIDRHGKERWAIENLQNPGDAVVLPGKRVLIAEWPSRVTERDFTGKIVWQYKVAEPISVQRLSNGNTLIASRMGAIREVDRAGKDIYVISNVAGGVMAAYRSGNGSLVCLTQQGQCLFLDTSGKRLGGFNTNHVFGDVGGINLLSNGRVLVTPHQGNKVVEYTAEGKKVLELNAPLASTATGLPNGHILVASHQAQRVYELDRAGKVVWERKGVGHVYRARQR